MVGLSCQKQKPRHPHHVKVSPWGQLQKVQQPRRYHPEEQLFTLFCDLGLDHNSAIQSLHMAIQRMIMCHLTKFSCKGISSSEDILESHILIIRSLTVTLTLKSNSKNWVAQIKFLLCYNGFGYVWMYGGVGNEKMFITEFKNRLRDCCC